MGELQAGVGQVLAILPQPPLLLQPRKAAIYDPAFGHDFERMQFASLGDLHGGVSTSDVMYALDERLTPTLAVTTRACTRHRAGLQRCRAASMLTASALP